ncbi:DnaD domain-containing protein [Enterococcus saccharolyticus]|uniref:Lin1244/Lin1753 domain-containing protein n=1 Tax=Enterococcus saccharolyticus TaxID=41997 RepID=UPI0010281759|nr:Lin1244/Lin1753 domain-containing protein [Enterococcus saccharolyticus]VFA67125.1 DnaD domain-containing protein [Enterococcus saccharolyticus]
MARPTKKGLDYFPLDVDFLSDLKVRRIIKACGKEAVHILVALLANIYRDEGYYVLWDDDLAFLVADEVGTKEGTVEELVKKAVQVKFFDKDIFDKYSVLTSKGIQSRYILATKERKKVELEYKYLLTNEVNRSNISINGRNNSVNQGNNQQSKEKESKEKESKEDATASESASLETFQKLWLFPNVVQVDDLLNLVDTYGDELVNAAIKLAGSKDVPKNRAISFLTASLQEWADANVNTIEQAREYQRTRGAKKQGYNQKPIREEQLPDWAENPVEEPQISPERQAEIDAKLAAYLSKKNQRKEQVE